MRVRGSAMIQRDGKLLTLAYDYPGGMVHAIPGGTMEDDERLCDCIIREFVEELGVEIELQKLRYVGDMTNNPHLKPTLHIVFDAVIRKGEPTLNPAETTAAGLVWLDMTNLDQVTLYPAINDALLKDGDQSEARYLGECMNRAWL